MGSINPLQFLMMLKSGNPRDIAISMINQNFANNPEMQQLIQMAQNNDIDGVNKFAEQFFKSRGMDYNNELANLMSTLKNM